MTLLKDQFVTVQIIFIMNFITIYANYFLVTSVQIFTSSLLWILLF